MEVMVKQNKINLCALLLLFLIINAASLTSARLLAANQADDIKETKVTEINSLGMVDRAESDELIGLEACESGDDAGCLKRRMVEEAHLDYIYTQQLEP